VGEIILFSGNKMDLWIGIREYNREKQREKLVEQMVMRTS
jgi:hypothetical protein